VALQCGWLDEIITYVEESAERDGETTADWMLFRVVVFDESNGEITHGWLPES
jgi:hypothetical protein